MKKKGPNWWKCLAEVQNLSQSQIMETNEKDQLLRTKMTGGTDRPMDFKCY